MLLNDEDDDYSASLSSLFQVPGTFHHYHFPSLAGKAFTASLFADSHDPGALQSGHYVWPAATALAQHLVDRPFDSPPPETALEVGAGCGLVSLVALQVYDLKQLVLTDHDPTTLQRAQLNYQATCRQLAQRPETVVAFELLTWGDEPAAKELLASESVKFDLIFGSDLIYDASVVTPLLKTVSWLLASGGKFVYSQSFECDKITNLEQDAACAELGLQQSRTPLHQNREHATKDTALLQIFQWTPKKMEQI